MAAKTKSGIKKVCSNSFRKHKNKTLDGFTRKLYEFGLVGGGGLPLANDPRRTLVAGQAIKR